MRRLSLAATIMALGLFVAASTWADVPDCDISYVDPESTFINASPDYTVTGTDAERYQDIDLYILIAGGAPYEGYLATNISFTVAPHSAYPSLGGGVDGNCPNCDQHYTVSCIETATDANGRITVRVDLGNGCAPSMCCPVEVTVSLAECPDMLTFGVLQNSHDVVTAGISGGVVDLSDISSFTTSIAQYNVYAVLQPCADWVFSAGAVSWGEITLADISAFTGHINESCTPFVPPCP